MTTQIIIMAGGVGSRFWPMSTPDYPKQFNQNRKIYQESSIYESFKIFRWCYKALQRRYACKAILTIMWCNQNEYNEQRGTTKDWLFPFVRLEAIVSGVSVISGFPNNYRLAVIGGEEGLDLLYLCHQQGIGTSFRNHHADLSQFHQKLRSRWCQRQNTGSPISHKKE